MGRYSHLDVGTLWVAQWREDYDPGVLALFKDVDAIVQFDEDDSHCDRTSYCTTASMMAHRLTAVNVGYQDARTSIENAWRHRDVDERRTDAESLLDAMREYYGASPAPGEGNWWDSVGYEDLQHDISFMQCDPLQLLRYMISLVPPETPVRFDMSEIWDETIVRTPTFCADAWSSVQDSTGGSTPTIVLTEGSSDASALQGALAILHPHLLGYVTFLDYGLKPEGGVESVIKGMTAFAAAGVSNRVVGLIDNDTAARDRLRTFDQKSLPSRMRILRLPDIDLARAYPTLGTEGLVQKDINGTAVSIELFFGRDVLAGDDGELVPVQMTGWNDRARAYQGSITKKSEIKNRFWRKLDAAKQDYRVVQEGDWDDLRSLLLLIVAEADAP